MPYKQKRLTAEIVEIKKHQIRRTPKQETKNAKQNNSMQRRKTKLANKLDS